MSKKFIVLAAVNRLGSFTVEELRRACGVGSSTVTTVLNRAPQKWFDKKAESNGCRGGQPIRYTLTTAGERGLAQEVAGIFRPDDLAKDAKVSDAIPLSLRAATRLLEKVEPPTDAVLQASLEQLRRYLRMAVSELNEQANRERVPKKKMPREASVRRYMRQKSTESSMIRKNRQMFFTAVKIEQPTGGSKGTVRKPKAVTQYTK